MHSCSQCRSLGMPCYGIWFAWIFAKYHLPFVLLPMHIFWRVGRFDVHKWHFLNLHYWNTIKYSMQLNPAFSSGLWIEWKLSILLIKTCISSVYYLKPHYVPAVCIRKSWFPRIVCVRAACIVCMSKARLTVDLCRVCNKESQVCKTWNPVFVLLTSNVLTLSSLGRIQNKNGSSTSVVNLAFFIVLL